MYHPVTICPGLPKVAMTRAWALARQGQRIYGGSVRQYLAEALRICWAKVKADPVAKAAAELINASRARRNQPPPAAPTPYLARFAGRYRGRVWGSSYL